MRNPETIITNRLRASLEARGGYSIKLSDKFTRGVPDLVAVGRSVFMVELKVYSGSGVTETYKRLGLSGAQDSRIRAINRRCEHPHAFVYTADPDDNQSGTLWIPLLPEFEGPGYESYRFLRSGLQACVEVLLG
jgi:hypothetical protein